MYSSHTRLKYKTISDAARGRKSIYEMTSSNIDFSTNRISPYQERPMKSFRIALVYLCFLLFTSAHTQALAAFGMLIPSRLTVDSARDAALAVSLRFWEPFENIGSDLEMPASFQVYHGGKTTDLSMTLTEGTESGRRTWQTAYTVVEPGAYAFVMEQRPIYDKDNDAFSVHSTKVYVNAFGSDEGWDSALGLKAEIVPLVTPGSLYAGNVFQGVVLMGGEPAPYAQVAVQWYPGPGKRGVAPHRGMITQVLRADKGGVFTYAAPRSGWWCFAASNAAKERLPYQNEDKPVEIISEFWVYFYEMPSPATIGK